MMPPRARRRHPPPTESRRGSLASGRHEPAQRHPAVRSHERHDEREERREVVAADEADQRNPGSDGEGPEPRALRSEEPSTPQVIRTTPAVTSVSSHVGRESTQVMSPPETSATASKMRLVIMLLA